MSTPRLRPTFTVELDTDREAAINTLRERFTADERFAGRWRGKGRWAELYVPHDERRIWSPHLSIRIDPLEPPADPDSAPCTLFGRFAPHPEIWTMLVFVYAAVAFLVVIGGIFGYVQWASNEAAWGLWAVWVGLPVLALIHLAGWVGQRWGHDQMVRLKSELDEMLEQAPLQPSAD